MPLILIFFAALFCADIVFARASVDISRHSSSANNYENSLGLGLDIDTYVDQNTDKVGVQHNLYFNYSNSKSVVNLNPNLDDFEIIGAMSDLNYNLELYEALTLSLGFNYANFNSGEAFSQSISYGGSYRFSDFSVGILFLTAVTQQKKQVVVLNQDITDNMKFNKKSFSGFFDYQWSSSFITRISGASYTYDENLDNFNTLLSTQGLLSKSGPSFLNEIQSQILNSIDISFNYFLNDSWMLQMEFGQSQDYLTPQDKSNNILLGFEMLSEFNENSNYRIFANLNTSKNEANSNRSNSINMGLGLDF